MPLELYQIEGGRQHFIIGEQVHVRVNFAKQLSPGHLKATDKQHNNQFCALILLMNHLCDRY